MLPKTKIPNLFSIIYNDLLKFLPISWNIYRFIEPRNEATNRAHTWPAILTQVRTLLYIPIGLDVALSAIDNLILTFDLVVIHSWLSLKLVSVTEYRTRVHIWMIHYELFEPIYSSLYYFNCTVSVDFWFGCFFSANFQGPVWTMT